MEKIVLYKELNEDITGKNNCSLGEVLGAIHVFHEASACGEFDVINHPHITLHADGSGSVINSRSRNTLFSFHTLREFVDESRRLEGKYNICWK